MFSSFHRNGATTGKLGLFPVAIVLGFLGFTGTAMAQFVLQSSPASVTFQYQQGGPTPSPQQINITSLTGSAISFTASVTSGSNLFTVAPADPTTPATLTVSVIASELPLLHGSAGGYITVVPSTGLNLLVQVNLNLTAAPSLTVSPTSLTFNDQIGQATPANQTLMLTSTGSALPYAVTISYPAGAPSGWLSVSPTSGMTPATLTVSLNSSVLSTLARSPASVVPSALDTPSPGTFTTTVVFTSGTDTFEVPVTVIIGGGAGTFSLAPTALSFAVSGTASPPIQPLVLTVIGAGQTYTGTVSYSASSLVATQNWLVVSPLTGATSATMGAPVILSANVNPTGLPEGTYNATVTVLSGSSSATASVNLLVSDKPVITSSGGAIIFNVPVGSSTPTPSQTLQLTSTDESLLSFTTVGTVSASSSVIWLTSAGEPIAMTPATVTLSVNPSAASLDVGTYVDTVNIFASTTPTGTPQITVPAILNITPLATGETPSPTVVLNSASGLASAISPGEIVSIFGANIGPGTPDYLTLTDGKVSTTLAGTQVLFDNVAAPLIYASATQINAIVPYEVAGRAGTRVSVIVNKTPSAELLFSVADTSPAIFTGTENGSGQGAIVNQNGTVNSTNNPAAPGSTVSIYGTGGGQTDPPGVTGSVTTGTPPFPVLAATPVSVTIGGQNAQIEYAGAAPGLVSGVLQVNVKIPTNAGSGAVPIVVSVGGVNSQANVTVSLR
jgi:trimeric autotransporter adhesin